MARTSPRGGPQTRARIAEAASGLFLDRGFEEVTVAQVAEAAGVSSVTVYNHFPRKEDLFLDRSLEASELLTAAAADAGHGTVVDGLRAGSLRLAAERHPLSGLAETGVRFFCTMAASPALLSRAREIANDLQTTLAAALVERGYEGDAALLSSYFVAGYGTVLAETGRRIAAGEHPASLVDDHTDRLERMLASLAAAESVLRAADRPDTITTRPLTKDAKE